jgi:hypothetical protein
LLTELTHLLGVAIDDFAFMPNFWKAWCPGLTPSYIISGIFARLTKAGHLASDADKTNRDLLIYMLWQPGQLTHQQIGENLASPIRR